MFLSIEAAVMYKHLSTERTVSFQMTRTLEESILYRPRHRWENDIKVDLK
jgi:hypothetical protein